MVMMLLGMVKVVRAVQFETPVPDGRDRLSGNDIGNDQARAVDMNW